MLSKKKSHRARAALGASVVYGAQVAGTYVTDHGSSPGLLDLRQTPTKPKITPANVAIMSRLMLPTYLATHARLYPRVPRPGPG